MPEAIPSDAPDNKCDMQPIQPHRTHGANVPTVFDQLLSKKGGSGMNPAFPSHKRDFARKEVIE